MCRHTSARKKLLQPQHAHGVVQNLSKGKTINIGCFVYMTGDAWAKTGDMMLKYMAGVIDRAELAKEINEYWRAVK
jgi:hypothetical protein